MFGFMSSNSPQNLVNLEIWRQVGTGNYNQWGDIDESAPPAPIPALAGRTHVETIENCVYEPRTTRVNARDAGVDGTTLTAVTVFLSDVTADVREGDFFSFVMSNGKREAWKLDGEAAVNNYVSPFTGIVGGRELFLQRVRGMK